MRLTSARDNEGSHAWSSSVGASVLATGLTQVVWVLREIRRNLRAPVAVGLDWIAFEAAGSGLFLWEAFISAAAKGQSDGEDAKIGVLTFLSALPNPVAHNAIHEEHVYSLVGAALLRSGWSADMSLLESSCLVIKAPHVAHTRSS